MSRCPDIPENYDEALVPSFDLPSLESRSGDEFLAERQRLLALFSSDVYGARPSLAALGVECSLEPVSASAVDDVGVMRQLQLVLQKGARQCRVAVLVFEPVELTAATSLPLPLFVGLNFDGNHTVFGDASIGLPQCWLRNVLSVTDNTATTADRGARSSRWPVR